MFANPSGRRIQAFANLALHFAWHQLKRVLPQGPQDGVAEFLEKYADDQIVPLSPGERDAFAGFERCLSCGLCQSACPVLPSPLGERFLGPESLAVSVTRPLPSLAEYRDQLYACTACGACERVCPHGVPVAEMAIFGRVAVTQRYPDHLGGVAAERARELAQRGATVAQSAPLPGAVNRAPIVLYRGCRGAEDAAATHAQVQALAVAGHVVTTIAEVCCGGESLACGVLPQSSWGTRLATAIGSVGARTVVVADAACYRSLRQEPALAHLDVRFLWEMLPQTRLERGELLLTPCPLQGSRLAQEGQRRVKAGCSLGEQCCGGESGLKSAYPEQSEQMGHAVLAQARRLGATAIVTESVRCRDHLRAIQGESPVIPIELLSQRLTVHHP